jgi:hypothetical protein
VPSKARFEPTHLGKQVKWSAIELPPLAEKIAVELRANSDRNIDVFRAAFAKFVINHQGKHIHPGNTKGGSITVPLTSCLTGLESAV